MNLTPIKVTIGLRSNGHADHPDWQKLPLAATDDPATHMGPSWLYDKTSGHQEDTPESPRGQQFGMLLVTPQFAKEAIATFPDIIVEMTEAKAKAFYEANVTAHLPVNKIHRDELLGLEAERNLRLARNKSTTDVDARIDKALDPADPTSGVTTVKNKTWDGLKSVHGVTAIVKKAV